MRTRTIQAAGKTPKWNQAFDLDVKDVNDDVTLIVWDEDNCSHDKVSLHLHIWHAFKRSVFSFWSNYKLTYEFFLTGWVRDLLILQAYQARRLRWLVCDQTWRQAGRINQTEDHLDTWSKFNLNPRNQHGIELSLSWKQLSLNTQVYTRPNKCVDVNAPATDANDAAVTTDDVDVAVAAAAAVEWLYDDWPAAWYDGAAVIARLVAVAVALAPDGCTKPEPAVANAG